MDRNAILGFLLIALIIIGWSFLFAPEPEPPREIPTQEEVAAGEAEDEAQQEEALEKDKKEPLPAAFMDGEVATPKTIVMENEHMVLHLSNQGGTPSYLRLKNYLTFDKEPLILIEDDWELSYEFTVDGRAVNTSDLYFRTEATDVAVEGDEAVTVVMTLPISEGRSLEQRYTMHGNSYMLDYEVVLRNFDDIIPRSEGSLNLFWKANLRQQERKAEEERKHTTVYYKPVEDDADYLSETSDEEEEIVDDLQWVGFKQRFFTQTLISETAFDGGFLAAENMTEEEKLRTTVATLALPFAGGDEVAYDMNLYFGPLHFETLKQYDLDLEEQVQLGWPVFREVNRYFILPIFSFLNDYIANFGIIILLLTIFIKLILSPLTYKSFLSSAKMRLLKPDLEELKEKYGKDMAKLQTEQMALYRKAGASPFGGCLPNLLQLPILLAMYNFFPSSIQLRQENFLWATDLSSYDSIFELPFEIPMYGDHVSLFTLLLAVATFVYSMMNRSMQPSMGGDQAQQMKMMMYLPPFFMLIFFNSFASALTYYYLLFNLLSIAQHLLFRAFIDEDKLHQKIQEKKKRKVKKSKWQAKMEEVMEQQKQQSRSQRRKK